MEKLLFGSMLSVPKAGLSLNYVDRLKERLALCSVKSKKWRMGGKDEEPTVVVTYKEDKNFLHVPRAFGLQEPPLQKAAIEFGLAQDVAEGSEVQFNFDRQRQKQGEQHGFPVGRQDLWVETLFKHLTEVDAPEYWGGIGQAPCAFGKTVLGLKLISLLARTTLIIVHKEFLMSQWRERALEWLRLKPEEIGYIQGDKCEFEGKKLVIGMVHSVAEHEYDSKLYNWPGVIVADEVHRMSAPTWAKAMPRFRAKYRIGLSATPRRKDGLEDVFKWAIGPVVAIETEWQVKPRVYMVRFPVVVKEKTYKWASKGDENKRTALGRLISIVAGISSCNDWLLGQIVKGVRDRGRTMFVLSDRKEQLTLLKDGFDAAMAGQAATSGYYWGGMKKGEREKSEQADAIFGTYQFAMEGADIPEVDTVILATPRSDVEQAVGRALRICEGKKDPAVLDIVHEGIKECGDLWYSRKRFYESKGWEVIDVNKQAQQAQQELQEPQVQQEQPK